jgi:hypothetical protein
MTVPSGSGSMKVERSLMEQRYQAVLEIQTGVPIVDVMRWRPQEPP